ncbi:MAG: Peptidyl-prolyl cis-trans isomerase [Parcubacteria group bacterium GW2011_GWC1_44_10]|nr:MAG: Peptidyl-prolyl cis-trans isomerase [Parcubacteria group bacterium GW2011_GWC1_44_10]
MQQILIIILIVAVLAAVGGIFYWLIKATAKIESGAPETAQKPTEKPAEARVEQKGGLKIEVLKEGSGPQAGGGAKAGNTVAVHYTGWLTNGQKFDSSLDRGQPFSLQLGQGQVIKGWEEGLLEMKVGEKRRLTIPPELGYGERGAGNMIPPNATLIFEVEMLEIK